MTNNFYHVRDGGHVLIVTNAETGMQAGVISPRGKVAGPFQVSGDKVSFTVELADGSSLGCVHKLPSGQLVTQFRV
tara:strand:+ start:965 stop:1192 length:228 start_codon:yes stop_codon:yes gene_type:complete